MLCEVPLTKEQQDFAAEHHGLVYKFLNDNHLPENEFYDVVIFPYLKAVQDYCNSASTQISLITCFMQQASCSAVFGSTPASVNKRVKKQCFS